jgi:hypothetical protein
MPVPYVARDVLHFGGAVHGLHRKSDSNELAHRGNGLVHKRTSETGFAPARPHERPTRLRALLRCLALFAACLSLGQSVSRVLVA